MQQSLRLLVVALCTAAVLTHAFPAGASEPGTAGMPVYEDAVPGPWRPLVSRKSYSDTLAAAMNFNKGLKPGASLTADDMVRIAASPCQQSMRYLMDQYAGNPEVPKALELVRKGVRDLPPYYKQENPWKSSSADELVRKMLVFFPKWCTNLPQINGSFGNGLGDIQNVSWLYYHNPAGRNFVQGRNPANPNAHLETGSKFTKDFTLQLGAFMDSPASSTYIGQWVNDPTIEMQDYQKQKAGDYKTWNEFFVRELTVDTANRTIPSRPVTMPDRDYVVVAPTDCIMNSLVQVITEGGGPRRRFLNNPLEYNTVLDVKGIPLSLDKLLAGVEEKYRRPFIGGTGQSCVLMPNTYHHFHSPVDGTIVHASIVKTTTFGYADWPNWVPTNGDVGRPGTDFSQFQDYQRGIVIVEVKYRNLDEVTTGYVALIPVGLESVGSVVLNKDIKPGVKVRKGYSELGNFYYGGSLNILLYSKGLAGGATQVRMGNQINLFNLGKPIE